jgi:hypothetical protein
MAIFRVAGGFACRLCISPQRSGQGFYGYAASATRAALDGENGLICSRLTASPIHPLRP